MTLGSSSPRFAALFHVVAPLALGLGAVSCGGSTDNGTSESPLGASALSGTWDLTATPQHSSAATGVLLLAAGHVRLTIGTSAVELRGTGDAIVLTSEDGHGVHGIDVTRHSAALDTGAFPLDVGGTWALSGNGAGEGQRCDAVLDPQHVMASCTRVDADWWHLGIQGSITGTRVSTAASSFGDLGGTWHLTQGDAACDATFAGNDLKVACSNAGSLTGSFAAHVTSTLASGTTGDGGEFAARRRQGG